MPDEVLTLCVTEICVGGKLSCLKLISFNRSFLEFSQCDTNIQHEISYGTRTKCSRCFVYKIISVMCLWPRRKEYIVRASDVCLQQAN